MTTLRILILSALCALMTACGGPGPEAEWVYGTWSEALTGETIEFRRDKTVRWIDGREGTFAFESPGLNLSYQRGPDGTLVIKVGGTVFYSAYYRAEIDRTSWELRFKEKSSFLSVHHPLLGKESHFLVLEKREGLSPYAPEGFVDALGADHHQLYTQLSDPKLVQGELIGQFYSRSLSLGRYNVEAQSLEVLPGTENIDLHRVYLGNEAIVNIGTEINTFTLDVGTSWRSLPKIRSTVDDIYPSSASLLGTQIFQLASQPYSSRNGPDDPRRYWLFRSRLSDPSPSWTLTHALTTDVTAEDYDVEVFTHEALSRVYLLAKLKRAPDDLADACKVFVSSDAGESFSPMPLPVQPSQACDLLVSESGIILTDVLTSANSLVASWYTSATDTWVTHTFDSNHDPSLAGAYLVDGDALISDIRNCGVRFPGDIAARCVVQRLSADGNIATLAELSDLRGSGNYSRPRIAVADGEVFLNALTVWRFAQ